MPCFGRTFKFLNVQKLTRPIFFFFLILNICRSIPKTSLLDPLISTFTNDYCLRQFCIQYSYSLLYTHLIKPMELFHSYDNFALRMTFGIIPGCSSNILQAKTDESTNNPPFFKKFVNSSLIHEFVLNREFENEP
jgi:hypothetical protein